MFTKKIVCVNYYFMLVRENYIPIKRFIISIERDFKNLKINHGPSHW